MALRFALLVVVLGASTTARAQQPPQPAAAACIDVVPAGPAAPAARAYLAMLDAWNAAAHSGDAHLAEPYFAHVADVVDCWYGQTARPAATIRAARTRDLHGAAPTLTVLHLDVIRADADDVVLLDVGIDAGEVPYSLHRKVVELRRVGGDWKLVGETGAASHGCLADGVAETPASRRIAACQAAEVRDRAAFDRDIPAGGCDHGCQEQLYAVGSNAIACAFGAANGPVWLTLPADGHVARIEDVVWTSMRAAPELPDVPLPRSCEPFSPTTVLTQDFDHDGKSEAIVLVRGTVYVYRLDHGSLVLVPPTTGLGEADSVSAAAGRVVLHAGAATHTFVFRGGRFVAR